MATSKRQEEKNMKILRDLVKRPENKRCFECDSLGPTYANLFNNTFVCVNCSGVLRGFEHRLKSISMATFKDDEIAALQRDGNDVGRAVWLGRFNARDEQLPDGKDANRLKEFIRLKYQVKKWYVPREQARIPERSDQPPAQNAQALFGNQQMPKLVVEPGVAAQGRPASGSVNGGADDIFGAIASQKPQADFFGGASNAPVAQSHDMFAAANNTAALSKPMVDDWASQPLPVGPQKVAAHAPAQPQQQQQQQAKPAAPKNEFESFMAEVSKPQTQDDKYNALKDLIGSVSYSAPAPAAQPAQQGWVAPPAQPAQQGWGAPVAQPAQQQGWGAPQPQPLAASPFGAPVAQPAQQQGWGAPQPQPVPAQPANSWSTPVAGAPQQQQGWGAPQPQPVAAPFGAPAAAQPAVNPYAAFGAAPQQPQMAAASPFGAPAPSPYGGMPAQPQPAGMFGAPAPSTSAAPQGGVFAQASPFGLPSSAPMPAQPTPAAANPFGGLGGAPAPAVEANPFGMPSKPSSNAFNDLSPFGANKPASSGFGTNSPQMRPQAAPAAAPAPANNPFGGMGGMGMGAPAANPFGAAPAPAANPFGAVPATTATNNNPFF